MSVPLLHMQPRDLYDPQPIFYYIYDRYRRAHTLYSLYNTLDHISSPFAAGTLQEFYFPYLTDSDDVFRWIASPLPLCTTYVTHVKVESTYCIQAMARFRLGVNPDFDLTPDPDTYVKARRSLEDSLVNLQHVLQRHHPFTHMPTTLTLTYTILVPDEIDPEHMYVFGLYDTLKALHDALLWVQHSKHVTWNDICVDVLIQSNHRVDVS